MSILSQLELIDEYIENRKYQESEDLLLSEGMGMSNFLGKSFSANKVPYSQNAPWAMKTDFDNDGIPDALDNHIGTGAESQRNEKIPYSQNAPWAVDNDFDEDGIPDALDNHIGPGAESQRNEKVPYSQNAPWAVENDFDEDGIPDALDDHIGPGANPDEESLDSDGNGIPDIYEND